MLKIKPLQNEVQIEVDEAKAGALQMESLVTAVEFGKVVAVGEYVTNDYGIKVGDKIMYKSWAVDICSHEGKRYYFINMTTNGIKGVIK